MKKLTMTLLFVLIFFLLPGTVNVVVSSTQAIEFENAVFDLKSKDLIRYDDQALQSRIGKKLKFKDKLVLKYLKRKLKKEIGSKPAQPINKTKTEKLANAALVLGILGLWIPVIPSLLAIILGAIAIKRNNREYGLSAVRRRAKIGLILGIVGIILPILVILIFLSFWHFNFNLG